MVIKFLSKWNNFFSLKWLISCFFTQERFNDDEGSGFKMFDSAGYLDNEGNTAKNLLFKDSTVQLRNITETYNTFLGDSYLNALETIKCERN